MPFRYLVILLIASLPATSQALPVDSRILQPSPSQHWQTLTSEHFQFHFTQQQAAYAHELAAIAEQVHSKLSPLLNWSPSRKTQVVINDSTDSSNGASTPLPYDQLYIYMTPPVSGDLLSRNEWMEEVFTHEYTHILHNDQAAGWPLFLRRIFGSTTALPWSVMSYPQLSAPHWLSEGIAIYMESLSGGGRNHSAIYNAKMREEVHKGLNSLTEESYEGYNPVRWPFGHVYLYGAYFFQFIEARYGQDKIFDYITNYSDNLIPWRMNKRAKEAFGKSAHALWDEFQTYLKHRFEPQIVKIQANGETPGKILTSSKYLNQFVTPGPDGSVFYYHSDLISAPEIRQTFPDGRTKTVRKMHGVTFMAWHQDKGLLIGQAQVCDNTSTYNDILLLPPQAHIPKRITHCARIKHAVWSADGMGFYAVQTGDGRSTLSSISLNGEITPLLPTRPGEVLGQISASPTGDTLALQIKTTRTGWNIEAFSTASHKRRPLTHNHDIEINPRYSNDGKSLYFISDHGDQMELRKLDIASGEVTTLSNSLGYAIDVSIDSASNITAVEYTGQGQRLRRISGNSTFSKPYKAIAESLPAPNTLSLQPNFQQKLEVASKAPVTEYRPLQTLRPFGWAPVFNITDQFDSLVGIQLSGEDILGFHHWSATPLYFDHEDINRLGGSLVYSYYDRFFISGSSVITTGADENTPTTSVPASWDEESRIQVLMQKPWNHRDYGWRLGLGSAWENIDHHASLATKRSRDQISGITLNFNNLELYGQSISPTEGFAARVTAETYDLGGNSDHSGSALITSLSGMFNAGGNHTLFGRLTSGTGDKGIKPFSLGEPDDVIATISGVTQLGARRFSLRGFKRQSALTGNRFLRTTAEWRFPIASVYDGFSSVPVGAGKIHGAAFIDSATINNKTTDSSWHTGVGIELTTDLLIGYDAFTIPITIGFAQGLDTELGSSNAYIRSIVLF